MLMCLCWVMACVSTLDGLSNRRNRKFWSLVTFTGPLHRYLFLSSVSAKVCARFDFCYLVLSSVVMSIEGGKLFVFVPD